MCSRSCACEEDDRYDDLDIAFGECAQVKVGVDDESEDIQAFLVFTQPQTEEPSSGILNGYKSGIPCEDFPPAEPETTSRVFNFGMQTGLLLAVGVLFFPNPETERVNFSNFALPLGPPQNLVRRALSRSLLRMQVRHRLFDWSDCEHSEGLLFPEYFFSVFLWITIPRLGLPETEV